MAQMNPPWPVNSLAGDKVPPDVDWLIGHLANINSTDRPDKTVVQHAFDIQSCLILLRVRGRGAYDLKGSIKGGFRVPSQIPVGGPRSRQ
jgi:hypothetical protein